MYVPPHFAEERPEVVRSLMRRHSFATLISRDGDSMIATHVPLLLDESCGPLGTLRGHFALPNPHADALQGSDEVLAIFQGPHAYVSPSWYASNMLVPTWNYQVVHAYGRPTIVTEEARVLELLRDTVDEYESSFPQPWRMDQLPEEFVRKLSHAIVAFEIELTRVEGKSKLSQNRSDADRAGVMEALEKQGNDEAIGVAQAMREIATRAS